MCTLKQVILERKKFGPQGWNRNYPFNTGDLSSCAQVPPKFFLATLEPSCG